jgi:hypothetical protein
MPPNDDERLQDWISFVLGEASDFGAEDFGRIDALLPPGFPATI